LTCINLASDLMHIKLKPRCPGYIHTEMPDSVSTDIIEKNILPQIPVGRLGKPDDIARAVVFLAADEAGFITRSTLSINGGQYMC
jgi:acetoacetyl-CoA reductase